MAHRGTTPRAWARAAVAASAVTGLVVAGVAPAAQADGSRHGHGHHGHGHHKDAFDLADRLERKVSERRVMRHVKAFDRIGARHDDTRASGTSGYDASVGYVVRTLRRAGYRPDVQEFEFPYFEEVSPAVLEADGTSYETGAYTFSGSGDVTAPVEGVDLALADPGTSTSGCEAEDFDGFTAGNVALVQRGACAFGLKAENAAAAGASAVVIFNQGNDPGRMDLIVGTLGAPLSDPLPVVGASFAAGQALAQAGTEAHVVADTVSETRTTYNVVAETRHGDDDNVVMVGAHLDSVAEGPGVNDNGSGSAAILETAVQLAKASKGHKGHGHKGHGRGHGRGHHDGPENTVRFAWWGAEELGLLGSEEYVADLSQDEVDDIAMYLNFDMVGSPNYVRFVYDGDNSRFGEGEGAAPGPPGSDAIEQSFHDAFASAGLASEETPFSGRSDYGPFIAEGVDIPAGGLFTGAEGTKTEEQAEIFGGEAGVAYDPCYHEACDTIDNVSTDAVDEMSAAIAKVTGLYAVSTHPVNGEGPEHPEPEVEGEPVGTGTPGGGGLHEHDHHPES